MPWKESLIEKLARLTREHEAKRRPEEWLAEQMWWQDWEGLTRQARVIAVQVLKGRRGGGVLPDGYDAESVAGEAIAGLFSGATPVVLGITPARLAGKLERLVRGKIRKLEKRKERALVGAEWTIDTSVLRACATTVPTVIRHWRREKPRRNESD